MKPTGLFLALLFVAFVLNAQTLDELRDKKLKSAEEIQYTNQLLDKAKKSERFSISRLRLFSKKISQRNNIISSLNAELEVFQELIDNNTLVVEILSEDIARIKKEYAEMIRLAYKNRTVYDKILFLLSSEDFNQAYKRSLYLKQYTDYRQKQAKTIEAIQRILDERIKRLGEQKAAKQDILHQQEEENKQLLSEKEQQKRYLQKLQSRQRLLRRKLREQRKIEQQLEKAIQRIIEEEARKSGKKDSPGFALTPEQKLIGDNFEKNKRRIPWPLERGIITEHFGLHKHAVLKNITVNNNGIDIATEPGAKARSVFKGEVSRIFGITGGNMAVIIRHGKYLTVYSNLKEVTVKKGDLVFAKQYIGTVYTDTDEGNKSILKFQIWRENQRLNPEEWIVK
ncbi:MAG: peptidoglycan DD-metalloendopeptidase family protein [Chlorobi bacterium]|nr:peptidoglycan DD-metalloendopeptidase family protein [Chlorobiota bacterium]